MPFFPLFTLPFYSPEIFLFSCSPFFNRRFCVLFLSHLFLTSFSSLSQLSFVSPSFFSFFLVISLFCFLFFPIAAHQEMRPTTLYFRFLLIMIFSSYILFLYFLFFLFPFTLYSMYMLSFLLCAPSLLCIETYRIRNYCLCL